MSDLLKVLDMKKSEQQKWWESQTGVNFGCVWANCLYEAAFRLRDECDKNEFDTALYEVYEYLGEDKKHYGFWARAYCKPIHWLIAALIATENE